MKQARNPTTNAQGRVGPPPKNPRGFQGGMKTGASSSYTSLKIFDFWGGGPRPFFMGGAVGYLSFLRIPTFALIAALQIAAAIAPHEAMPNPDQDRRARALYQEVRCVVCQNESIADSSADIAADLRADVRARIAEGKTDKEIREGLVGRYGDYVLFRPRITVGNLLLWATPFLVLLAGVAAFISLTRHKTGAPVADDAQTELSPEEKEALQRRLEAADPDLKDRHNHL